MNLVVGQPVYERAWILPYWFDCLEAQNLAPKEDITLCFAYSKSYDGTYDILMRRGEEYGNLLIYEYDTPTYKDRQDMSRFHMLAAIRNSLLDMVKEVEPDYYLSWDNDILFYPDTLKHLWEPFANFAATPTHSDMYDIPFVKDIKNTKGSTAANYPTNIAVGALIDMGGRDELMAHPSIMDFGVPATRRKWDQYPASKGVRQEADIIMAVKLMGKEVYQNTRYYWDITGEDIGWSRDAGRKSYKKYLQPKARGYHIYDKDTAIRIMKVNSTLDYPEIIKPLSEWWKNSAVAEIRQ